jgi:hypothetical protein
MPSINSHDQRHPPTSPPSEPSVATHFADHADRSALHVAGHRTARAGETPSRANTSRTRTHVIGLRSGRRRGSIAIPDAKPKTTMIRWDVFMTRHRMRLGVLMVVAISACAHSPPVSAPPVVRASPPPRAHQPRFVVLPAESFAFPRAARATTESLLRAQVGGAGAPQLSKVPLEVVQLSIECVDPSAECYEAVGRSLTASRLLFAQIAAVKRKQIKVTVTLFTVDANAPRTKAERVFASEDDATAGVAELVAEATRP